MASQDGAAPPQRRHELAKLRGEPIETVERSIINLSGADYVNVPEESVALLNLDDAEYVEVERWDDRVVIYPPGGNDA